MCQFEESQNNTTFHPWARQRLVFSSPFVSSLAFCVAKSANQCRAEEGGAVSGQGGLMAFSSLLLFAAAELSAFGGSSGLMSVLSALGTWSGSGVVTAAGPPPPEKVVVSFPEEALGFMLGS